MESEKDLIKCKKCGWVGAAKECKTLGRLPEADQEDGPISHGCPTCAEPLWAEGWLGYAVSTNAEVVHSEGFPEW